MTITYTLYNVFGILLSLNICSHFVINGGKESRGIKYNKEAHSKVQLLRHFCPSVVHHHHL